MPVEDVVDSYVVEAAGWHMHLATRHILCHFPFCPKELLYIVLSGCLTEHNLIRLNRCCVPDLLATRQHLLCSRGLANCAPPQSLLHAILASLCSLGLAQPCCHVIWALCLYVAACVTAKPARTGVAAHWEQTSSPAAVHTCVVLDAGGIITDLVSYYTLPSSVIGNDKYDSLKAAFMYYTVVTKTPLQDLMQDILILASNRCCASLLVSMHALPTTWQHLHLKHVCYCRVTCACLSCASALTVA